VKCLLSNGGVAAGAGIAMVAEAKGDSNTSACVRHAWLIRRKLPFGVSTEAWAK